jgi:hypothetical protein
MLINLKQTEIEQALRDYLSANGIGTDGREIAISFSQRRTPTVELSAEIDLNPEAPAAEEAAPSKPKRSKPRAVVESPAPTPENMDTSDEEDSSEAADETPADVPAVSAAEDKKSLFS